MKTIGLFFYAIFLLILFSCGHQKSNNKELVFSDVVEPTDSNTIFEMVEEESTEEMVEDKWKTDRNYTHFTPCVLDTVFIGAEREITDPFDFFKEERSNLYVQIDSGRYLNDDGLWLQGENVIIRGENGVSLLIDKLYDNVMWVNGNNIVIDNLHMMHLMPGESEGQNCSGRVIGFDGADNVTIVNCDLNGCGLAGLHDNLGNGTIYVEHNYIHNNSLGAYTNIDGEVWQEEIDNHETFVFLNNRIENNGFDRIMEDGEDFYEEDFHGDH